MEKSTRQPTSAGDQSRVSDYHKPLRGLCCINEWKEYKYERYEDESCQKRDYFAFK